MSGEPNRWDASEAQRLANIQSGIGCAHGRTHSQHCEPCSRLERCSHGEMTFKAVSALPPTRLRPRGGLLVRLEGD